jgi:hypothetical protein
MGKPWGSSLNIKATFQEATREIQALKDKQKTSGSGFNKKDLNQNQPKKVVGKPISLNQPNKVVGKPISLNQPVSWNKPLPVGTSSFLTRK